MKKISFLLCVLIVSLLFFGCKKDTVELIDGKYTGVFTVTYSSGIKQNPVTLEFKNGRYVCSGNPDRIPAGGSGTYSVNSGKITFSEENFWTADFDWNLILNGQYNYSFDGKVLILSVGKNDVSRYEYKVERNSISDE